MKTIGFMGMGIMGFPMAVNLVKKSGQEILGFDIFQEKRVQFAAQGGKAVESEKVIFAQCDLIFLCLPTNDLVRQTILNVLAAAKPGVTIVDFSSTSPDVIDRHTRLRVPPKEIYLYPLQPNYREVLQG